MNDKIINLIFFVAGSAIGSLVTWKIIKKKYEQMAQEEIDSVKKVFSKKNKELENKDTSNEKEDEDTIELGNKVIGLEYVESITDKPFTPYIISPEEFGENDNYETSSLTFYSDGILADEDDEMVDDVDSLVGFESLNHFGEYEDDSVFVRNDRLETDFEILLNTMSYSDILKEKPYLNTNQEEVQ